MSIVKKLNNTLSTYPDLSFILFFFVLVVVMFARVLFSPGALISHSDINYFFAHETIIRHSIAQNDFLLWNPYFGGGAPALGKIQPGLLYPPLVLLRSFLPIATMFNWDVVLHVWLAGVGVYWLMRDLGVNRPTAVFCALAFAFSGSIIPRIQDGHVSILHCVTWTGWLLFAYRRLLNRDTWWHLLLCVIFTVFVILGGHPQMSLIVLLVPVSYFILVYLVQNGRSKNFRALVAGLKLSAFVALLSAGLLAVQLIPFAEWLNQTARGQGMAIFSFEHMTRHSFNLEHFPTLFLPFLWFDTATKSQITFSEGSSIRELSSFVGVFPLVVIGLGAMYTRHKRRYWHAFLAGLAFFGLVMSMGRLNPIYQTIYNAFPYMRAPGRFLLLWTFPITILSGFTLNELPAVLLPPTKPRTFGKFTYFVTVVAGLSIITAVIWRWFGLHFVSLAQSRGFLDHIEPQVFYGAFQRSFTIFAITLSFIAVLLWLSLRNLLNASRWQGLTIALLLMEIIFFVSPLVWPYPVRNLYDADSPWARLDIDPGQVRIPGYRKPPNYLVPTLVHTANGEEYAPLQALMDKGENGTADSLLSAGYIVRAEPLDSTDVELIQQKDSAYLYRLKRTLPRIYAAPSLSATETDAEALEIVTADEFDPFRQAVITKPDAGVLDQLAANATEAPPNFRAEYLTYKNSMLSARIVTDRPVMVIFSEMYYPGWQAFVDGQSQPIWKANYVFRGVTVEKGEHLIEMRFVPGSFTIGLAITLISASIIIGISGWQMARSISRLWHRRHRRGLSRVGAQRAAPLHAQ